MTIKIVKAKEKHVDAIGQLWWEFMLFHQKADPIFTPREGSIPGFEENQVRRFMKSEEGLVLVALDGTKVVGFSLAELREPSPGYKRDQYGIIDTTAVTESYRRKGIGEKMVREAMKWFQLKNVDRVELETAAENLVANSFWKKQGFKVLNYTLFKEI